MTREEMIIQINEYFEMLSDESIKILMELIEVYPAIQKK